MFLTRKEHNSRTIIKPVALGIRKSCLFAEKEKQQKLKKKLWNQGQNEQQTQLTYDAVSELRPHWWEGSSLTTAPSLTMGTMTAIYTRTLVSIQYSSSLFSVDS